MVSVRGERRAGDASRCRLTAQSSETVLPGRTPQRASVCCQTFSLLWSRCIYRGSAGPGGKERNLIGTGYVGNMVSAASMVLHIYSRKYIISCKHTPSAHTLAFLPTYLHCFLQFLQHQWFILKEKPDLLHNGIDIRFLCSNHAEEVEQLGNGEEQQLFILDSQQGHFFTPLGEHLGCLVYLGRKERKRRRRKMGKTERRRREKKGLSSVLPYQVLEEEIILQLRWRSGSMSVK